MSIHEGSYRLQIFDFYGFQPPAHLIDIESVTKHLTLNNVGETLQLIIIEGSNLYPYGILVH